jgi:hypothetical protein
MKGIDDETTADCSRRALLRSHGVATPGRDSQQIPPLPDGANRQSGDPSATLLLKLVLEVVIEVAGCFHVKDYSEHEYSSPGRD